MRTETFRSSFIPSLVKLWNSLEVCDRTLTYSFVSRFQKSSVKHAQLRMKSSKLNFDLHIVDSPACVCGHNREDSNHYLITMSFVFSS